MRNIGIIAFGITVGILAPAALIELGAGPHQRDMLFAPGADSLEVNGVKVHAKLDRKLVERGDTVHVSLTADARVTVGVVVLGSSGTEGARVPEPPVGVAHETITLEANKATSVPIKLKGARVGGEHGMATYTVYVLSEKAGDRLALLQRRAGPNIPTGEIPDQDTDTSKLYQALYSMNQADNDDKRNERLFGPGKVARLQAFARPVNPSLAMSVQDTATVDKSIPVTITIKNPTQRAMTVKVSLETPSFDDSYLGLPANAIKLDSADDITLAKGETKKLELHVTASQVGLLGLQASVDCKDGDTCWKLFRTNAFDAVQISSATPAVAAK